MQLNEKYEDSNVGPYDFELRCQSVAPYTWIDMVRNACALLKCVSVFIQFFRKFIHVC